jgi:hypothetical protein
MKNLSKITTLTIAAILFSLFSFSQVGPGGIGSDHVVWLRAYDLQGTVADGTDISTWTEQTGNNNNANQTGGSQPTYFETGDNTIAGQPVLYFDGVNEMLRISNTNDINSAYVYNEKTLMVIVKTSDDITSRQMIYEEGAQVRGINIYIQDGKVYFGAWNLYSGGAETWWGFYALDYDIEVNKDYMFTLKLDAANDEFKAYVNGNLIGVQNNVAGLFRHTGGIGIGAVNNVSYTHEGRLDAASYFKGSIAEFVYFNDALTEEEMDDLEDEIGNRYGFYRNGILPVEMISYTAVIENDATYVNWSTASEINNDYFTIERSEDMQNWYTVGTVSGAGNTNIRMDYEFVDFQTVDGTAYYRISQTDFDGTTEVFSAMSVSNESFGSKSLEIISTNSDSGVLRIEFTTESSEPVELAVYSTNGSMISTKTLYPYSGSNTVSLNVDGNGIGIINMVQGNTMINEKALLR